ncbi:MAG: hypothetical protein DCO98_02750 [Altererythrobacter sp. XM-24bin4]|uniref:glycosyltransferase family 4 protein n=1 Tax=uncultured Altererythrobacter sp. TaxID=500840 RepID=UPI000D79F702|nr:glycosyltransferase family 1 protein [uncultured Altererythrobacter sp.]PWL25282.1 MAG: hypothetical protein DCO98_02750 [Altererythrobacter sp. XM-24bin4]
MSDNTVHIFVEGHALDGSSQGVTTYIANLYKNFEARQFNIFVGLEPGSDLSEYELNGDNIHPIYYSTQNKFWRYTYEIPLLIKRHSISVAHFQYITPLWKNCSWITTIHDILPLDFRNQFPLSFQVTRTFFYWVAAKRSDICLTVSNYTAERIRARFGAVKHLEIIENGIDQNALGSDRLGRLSGGSKKPYILCVSRFENRKRQHLLLELIAQGIIDTSKFDMIFVGAATHERTEFDTRLPAMPSRDRKAIFRFEHVSTAELTSLYEDAVLTIYPSLAEGFGLPVIESFANGTPCFFANNTAMTDFRDIAPEFAFDNPDDLNRKIEQFLREPKYFSRSLENAKQKLLERYDWSRSAVRLQKLIFELDGGLNK